MKSIIATGQAPASPFYSQAVQAGGFLFVSGMTGVEAGTGKVAGAAIDAQTTQALRNCEAILHAAGASLREVVEVQVLLARFEDFAGMNEAYARVFPADPPARSIAKLGVQLPGVLVSIRMVAFGIDPSRRTGGDERGM